MGIFSGEKDGISFGPPVSSTFLTLFCSRIVKIFKTRYFEIANAKLIGSKTA